MSESTLSKSCCDAPAARSAPGCCGSEPPAAAETNCCGNEVPAANAPPWRRVDWLLWASVGLILAGSGLHFGVDDAVLPSPVAKFSATVVELLHMMWWGVLIGIAMIAVIGKIPREFVMAVFGTGRGFGGLCRAVLAGVLLDLCNHGILMVAAKLYERGVSSGQVVAFLVASPWNSLSLTLILVALIGLPWTVGFVLLSMLVALVTGALFEWLERRGTLPPNPSTLDLPDHFDFWREAKSELRKVEPTPRWFWQTAVDGVRDSRMVLRWIFFGVVLAGVVRAVMSPDQFESYFGPTLLGLAITMVFATVLEVCSEGTVPISADILNHAGAPGNSFAFLMTGVATDYTEIMVLRETTGGWKIPLFLPLLTVPQVLLIAWIMNQFSV